MPHLNVIRTMVKEIRQKPEKGARTLEEVAILTLFEKLDLYIDFLPEDSGRLRELSERLVLPGGKAQHLSMSECHEIFDLVVALLESSDINKSSLEVKSGPPDTRLLGVGEVTESGDVDEDGNTLSGGMPVSRGDKILREVKP